jgi:hypothetical protein
MEFPARRAGPYRPRQNDPSGFEAAMAYSRTTPLRSPSFTHVIFLLQDFYYFRLLNKLILCVL